LERILANPLFTHSKRYPCLLRYVVEHAIEGQLVHLKERTLGVEVFGRDPGYDTNLDPVVRTTAGEIRRRIAQYYHEGGHEGEIRIDLPSGSYVPEFHPPARPVLVPLPESRPAWIKYAGAGAVLGAVLGIGVFALVRSVPWAPPSALERFWKPVLEFSGPLLLCVGQPRSLSEVPGAPPPLFSDDLTQSEVPVTVQDLHRLGNQHVALADATTLSRLAGLMQAKGKPYHIRGRSSTTFTDLRDGPVVLIGAFNNEWTLRITGQLRFSFDRDKQGISWIQDQKNPAKRDWMIDFGMPYLKLTEDYALISRVWDPTTARIVVVAAGITKFGTIAAGEFLTDPSYMEALAKDAPRNWDRQNIQAVIATKVINGNCGPPRIVATHFW
jgi:hypothetical protein